MKIITEVVIIGAGSIARDIADLARDIPNFEVLGFVIDQPPFERGSKLSGKPVFWIDELADFNSSVKAICGLARMKKINIINKVKQYNIQIQEFIHPNSRVSPSATLDEGVVINSGVQVATSCKVGKYVYVNRGALIGHDTMIGDNSVISPGVNIAGNVNIGKNTYIGIGSIISERVSIGEGCFICAGSLVTRDVPNRVKVIGSPARIIEREIRDF